MGKTPKKNGSSNNRMLTAALFWHKKHSTFAEGLPRQHGGTGLSRGALLGKRSLQSLFCDRWSNVPWSRVNRQPWGTFHTYAEVT
jgi:hypothetical protein